MRTGAGAFLDHPVHCNLSRPDGQALIVLSATGPALPPQQLIGEWEPVGRS